MNQSQYQEKTKTGTDGGFECTVDWEKALGLQPVLISDSNLPFQDQPIKGFYGLR